MPVKYYKQPEDLLFLFLWILLFLAIYDNFLKI